MLLIVLANVAALTALLYGIKLLLNLKYTSKAPLPPGPKPWPLIGNIQDLPAPGEREWEHWAKHKDLYGPISSVTVLGSTMIIINDAKVAIELMEKRSNKHSSRPRLVFGGEMVGWEKLLVLVPYGDRLRFGRKQIHALMGTPAALARYIPLQEVEAHRFLLRVLKDPEDFLQHIRTEAGAIILKVTYGYNIEPFKTDPLLKVAEEAIEGFSQATIPGAWLVDTIPALKYVPDWFPFTDFKRKARSWKAKVTEMLEVPFQIVKTQMTQEHHEPSFVADIFEKNGGKLDDEEEDVAKWNGVSMFGGGADTTVITIQSFFLAMVLHPEIQARAQEEIDRVIGTHRLPNLEDRPRLPYIDAVVQEAFRWHTIAPMGMPHVTTQDDIFNGYLVPKGAVLLPNIWLFTHDSETYSDSRTFNPDRFLEASPDPDPRNFVFGFGRRICPGRLLADSSVWLTIAKSLASFDIGKGLDAEGHEIEPEVQFTTGILSHPVPFKAMIKPRSSKHAQLIEDVERTHPWERSGADTLDSSKFWGKS